MLLGFSYARPRRATGPSGTRASVESLDTMWSVTTATVDAIARIFYDPQARKEVSGVVGSYEATRQSFEFDTAQALYVLALISLSLAVVNLFPFLPLDGGHIFWALAEKMRGRPIPYALIERASVVGLPARRLPVHHRPDATTSADCAARASASDSVGPWSPRRCPAGAPRASTRRRSPRPSGITARQRADEVAVRTKDDAVRLTWAELRERVDALAGGLSRLGVRRGDSVALMLTNRPEFSVCDLAVMMCGGAAFSIYQTTRPTRSPTSWATRRRAS